MSPPASERAERITREVRITPHLAPHCAARTAQRAVPIWRWGVAVTAHQLGTREDARPPGPRSDGSLCKVGTATEHYGVALWLWGRGALGGASKGTPFGYFTTMVPAILSCHDCFSRSQPAQKNPRNKAAPDRKLASERTSATAKSIGLPSWRMILIPSARPPTVVPFHAHIPMW